MKQMINRWFARFPKAYLRVLTVLGRGSMEKRIFLALTGRGDIIFDVGANRGLFTLQFSEIAGPEGKVHAFEPVSATFELLHRSVGHLRNVILNHCALGDVEVGVILHRPGGDDGQASLRTHQGGSWQSGVEVHDFECRMMKLDTYAAHMTRIDFVKCDVEGAEGLVITGAVHVMKRLSPLLFLEVNPQWMRAFDYTAADLFDGLRRCGYDTFYLVTDTVVTVVGDWPDISGNLIAAKKSIHAARLKALSLF